MKKKQFTRKQHYISQGLLKLFSDDGNHIYECLVSSGKVYQTDVTNAMEENCTYEHPLLEENTLEDAFATIEGSFIPQVVAIANEVVSSEKFTSDTYAKICQLLEIFLLFYYRSGAVLSEFCYGVDDPDTKKRLRVRRLLEIITTRSYLKQLANSLRNGYECSLLYAGTNHFIISDQYLSTVALSYKNQFVNTSNRAIGMKDTMVLIPLSSKLYVAFFNGKVPDYIERNQISHLSESQVFQINKIIFHNSFKKCASPNSASLHSLKEEKYFSHEATQVFFGNDDGCAGGYTNKKEVFFYPEDEEICTFHIQYTLKYRDLKKQYGKAHIRNIKCPCGSGKKFKICCLAKYERAYQAVEETQNPKLQNYRISDCIAEMPIYEFWNND